MKQFASVGIAQLRHSGSKLGAKLRRMVLSVILQHQEISGQDERQSLTHPSPEKYGGVGIVLTQKSDMAKHMWFVHT